MNQILATENNKKEKKVREHKPIGINKIVRFFAATIIIFGLTCVGEGAYAIYRENEDIKPANIPKVTIGRINDKAIIQIENNIEISKIMYSWDNGEENVIPISDNTVNEEITLLGYDSILNLTVEDVDGKQVKYQKQYLLTGKDITKPRIDMDFQDGNDKIKIVAIDETAIEYLSYQWDGEDVVTINSDTEEQTQIIQEVKLTAGTKNITITAQDRNGNIETIQKEVTASTSIPQIKIVKQKDKSKIKLRITDKDGAKDIKINLNGKEYKITDVDKRENVDAKNLKLGPLTLKEGNNTILIEVTNVSGYTQKVTTELKYDP